MVEYIQKSIKNMPSIKGKYQTIVNMLENFN